MLLKNLEKDLSQLIIDFFEKIVSLLIGNNGGMKD
jgi:hypothetical protein